MIDSRSQRIMLVDFGIARFVAPSQKGSDGNWHHGVRAAGTFLRQRRTPLGYLFARRDHVFTS